MAPLGPLGISALGGPSRAPPPLLFTLVTDDKQSVLSLAVDSVHGHVFGASQQGDIHVWSLRTLLPVARLVGHSSSVLSLILAPERSWLLSSSGDNSVRVWDTRHFGPALYTLHPPTDNTGDVLCLAWSSTYGMLYLGCQDTSILWTTLPWPAFSPDRQTLDVSCNPPLDLPQSCTPPTVGHPLRSPHKFFDSMSQVELLKASREASHCNFLDVFLPSASTGTDMEPTLSLASRITRTSSRSSSSSIHQADRDDLAGVERLRIDERNILPHAHFGYIYCLVMASVPSGHPCLLSGSGDGTIKVWSLHPKFGQPSHPPLATLKNGQIDPEGDADAVLALSVRQSTLFAGLQGGKVKVWDLETFTCIRTLSAHQEDVLTMSISPTGEMISCCAGGHVTMWDSAFEKVESWKAHGGCIPASSIVVNRQLGCLTLFTGGSDNSIKLWSITQAFSGVANSFSSLLSLKPSRMEEGLPDAPQGRMLRYLSQFIEIQSISDDNHREECRQAALFLKKTLTNLGAHAKLLPGAPNKNPLVLATFVGRATDEGTKKKKRVLFYGHYDVVQPGMTSEWTTKPFELTGRNGWLYGRGVSDNKGPILAVACAASLLLTERALDVDLVMLIEGEEEAGSAGFQEAVRQHKDAVGDVDLVLVSNSYWLGEATPCMTFGLRGVIHASVTVTSDQPDLHSGMQGGVVHEPVLDLVRILSSLLDETGQIRIPGFYDGVSQVSDQENQLYDRVLEHLVNVHSGTFLTYSHVSNPRDHLISTWRSPALSVHNVEVSGPTHSSVIPSSAKAGVSIRVVPNQSLQDISNALKDHLMESFAKLKTANSLSVDVYSMADWWLGDPSDSYSKSFEKCIEAEWGRRPLWIREGGSIPGIPFLESEFNTKAVHFPMGAGSDSAHLPNEKIRMVNLERGRNVVKRFLRQLSSLA